MGGFQLLLAGLLLRVAGSGCGGHESRPGFRGVVHRGRRWLFATLGAWLAIGAVGAWSPLWPTLAVALLASLWPGASTRPGVRFLGDLTAATSVAVLSMPSLAPFVGIGAVLAWGAFGALADAGFARASTRLRIATSAAIALTFVAYAATQSSRLQMHLHGLARITVEKGILDLGITPLHGGERVTLRTGATAWFDRPPGAGSFPAAVVFHGDNPMGARQPAACVLRRALVAAGFMVLAVDHPGYGASPSPDPAAPIEAWDPFPTSRAALDMMKARSDVTRVLVVGHSMGCREVLRILSEGEEVAGAVLVGASLLEPDNDEYWHRRFLDARGLDDTVLSFSRYLTIRRRFYDPKPLADGIEVGHPPILFVNFAVESPAITGTRDELFAMLPEPKRLWVLADATHYFSALVSTRTILVGDTRTTQWVGQRLRRFVEDPLSI